MDRVQTQTVEPAAQPENPEQILAQQAASSSSSEGEPQLLAGKYKTPQELERAYKELEQKLGQTTSPQPSPQPSAEPANASQQAPSPPTAPPADASPADNLAIPEKPAGMDFSKYEQEFMQTGNLSPDSYNELSAKGIPKQMVDAYIEGQKASAAAMTRQVFEAAGGEESYKTMIGWAQQSMSDADRQAFNQAIANPATRMMAVESLQARYTKANGQPPARTVDGARPTAAGGFRSWSEVTEAMNDPRYAKDPAYTRDVEQRLANSKL